MNILSPGPIRVLYIHIPLYVPYTHPSHPFHPNSTLVPYTNIDVINWRSTPAFRFFNHRKSSTRFIFWFFHDITPTPAATIFLKESSCSSEQMQRTFASWSSLWIYFLLPHSRNVQFWVRCVCHPFLPLLVYYREKSQIFLLSRMKTWTEYFCFHSKDPVNSSFEV